ncbi:RluA family pseudouridine synthase, partial [[Ruminococcus] torques]
MATLNILYEDPHILVCVKPHGIATQSKSIRYPDMVSLIKNHLAKSSGSRNPGSAEPYLAVIHRLDQPVAGILVFAKTPAAAKDLNKQLQNQG